MSTNHEDGFCACAACDYEIPSASLDEVYPDGHYASYCAICDEVDCSNSSHE